MKRSLRPAFSARYILFTFLMNAPVAFLGAQAAPQTSVQGVIAFVDAGGITLSLSDGHTEAVVLNKDTLVLSRVKAALGDIKPGDALGVAAKKDADGSLTATSINIFSPELWKVVRKGQWPMESGEIMTNAVVVNLKAAMVMGQTLFMKYEDGTATIAVPAGADIHRLLTLTAAGLKPGLKVSVRGVAGAAGSLTAATVSFDTPQA